MYYLLKRILIFIPTFLAVTMIAFFMKQLAPGDSIDMAVRGGYLSDYNVDESQYRHDYLLKAKELQLDEPVFYISVLSSAHPSDYQKIIFPADRAAADEIIAQAGSWKFFIPSIRCNGVNNQYHHWFTRLLGLDFGKSYITSESVSDRIQSALRWTLTINSIAIFLAFGISIWLGVWLATTKRSWSRNMGSIGLYVLYSIPSFWTATMLVVFFTTPEYGVWTDLFPTNGLGRLPAEAPFWNRFWETSGHLILPIFCITYGAVAFITMQMRKAMESEMNQQYIQAARARGFSERHIIWREAFPNALFPMITLFAMIIPILFTGSVVIEVIFGIPGMGLLTLDAINSDDWPIVYGVLVVVALVTMIGSLIGDVLYAWFNPKVSF